MRTKRKTEIHLEVEEAVAVRTRTVLIAYCQTCGRQARMVAANEAAMIAHLSAREIYRFVEAGRLHFMEDRGGLLYVCADSLQCLTDEASIPAGSGYSSDGPCPSNSNSHVHAFPETEEA